MPWGIGIKSEDFARDFPDECIQNEVAIEIAEWMPDSCPPIDSDSYRRIADTVVFATQQDLISRMREKWESDHRLHWTEVHALFDEFTPKRDNQ